MSSVVINGRWHPLTRLSDMNRYWWIWLSGALMILWSCLFVGAIISDTAGVESYTTVNNEKQTVVVPGQDADIDYLKIFGLLVIPGVIAGVGAYDQFFAGNSKRRISTFNMRDEYGNWQKPVQVFEAFAKKNSYNQDSIKLVWIGGIETINRYIEALRLQSREMDGPFRDSLESSVRTAERVAEKTKSTFLYLRPVMELPGSSTNDALLTATERMVSEIRECKDLQEACSELYVKSGLSMTHAEVVKNDVERIRAQLEAFKDIDRHALTTGS